MQACVQSVQLTLSVLSFYRSHVRTFSTIVAIIILFLPVQHGAQGRWSQKVELRIHGVAKEQESSLVKTLLLIRICMAVL